MAKFLTPERFDYVVCSNVEGTFITICSKIVTLYHYNKTNRNQLIRDCDSLIDALVLAYKLRQMV